MKNNDTYDNLNKSAFDFYSEEELEERIKDLLESNGYFDFELDHINMNDKKMVKTFRMQ